MPRPRLPRPALALLVLAVSAVATGCLAPAPPIVVDTPYGAVRASNEESAAEVAGLLERLAPAVRATLPGAQDRSIDIWVQKELQVYRFTKRPESVRGFTLLEEEFDARRIHLQEEGQSPWYLAHELVHALIGEEWSTLPGILEEGLADVVAERLNPEHRAHIRAHRLLNASAFSDGLRIELAYREPARTGSSMRFEGGTDLRRGVQLRLFEAVPVATARELLETDRRRLHERWSDIPESFYGFAWLVVSRIAERRSLEGLFDLCRRAHADGLDLVPADWLLDAADLDLDAFTPGFLASCFGRFEFQRAVFLQPEAFAYAAIKGLAPLRGQLNVQELFYFARPMFRLPDGKGIALYTVGPVRERVEAYWLNGTSSVPVPTR